MKQNLKLGQLQGERLIRQGVVAKKVGINPDTLTAWEAAGFIPQSVKIGPKGLRFYAASVIEPWLIEVLSVARGDRTPGGR